MTIDHVETAHQPSRAVAGPGVQLRTKKGGWGGIFLVLLVLAAGGGGGWWYLNHREAASAKPGAEPPDSARGGTAPVEVVHPLAGGMERVSTQPGSVHSFEWADLYAKLSGYLKEQSVDIGDTVKKDQVLAIIDDPEIIAAEKQAAAALEVARAKVHQAEAKLTTARAEVDTAKADVKRYESEVSYRRLQYQRFYDLFSKDNSVPRQRVDEEREHLETSRASEASSRTQIKSAEAKIEEAKADLAAAGSNVAAAQADLEKARVFVQYTKLISPYDGVITKRTYHRGSFIRSASDGEGVPVLSVARTDVMRVITKVPDRDVPFVNRGDPAIVQIDALGGREFKGPDVKVSRFAEYEDPDDRTMRTEVDVKNPDGMLHEGMYGKTTIILEASSKALTIPSSCLASETKGKKSVYVIRDKKVERKAIKVGRDDGLQMEILSGLTPEDEVVMRPSTSMAVGMAAEPRVVKPSKSTSEEEAE